MIYITDCELQRREGTKVKLEKYLVDAVSITDVEVKVKREFQDIPVEVTGCKKYKINDIFETGEGTFYLIKIIWENEEGKSFKDAYIQEAEDHSKAEEYFRRNVNYGEITDINLTNYMGILR